MSKKSRRRNRRLLKALGAGLAIAGLGRAFSNRNKTSAADVDSGRGGDSSSAVARVLANTPEENSFKVQDVKVNVPSKKPVVNLSRMTGSGPEKGEIGQAIRADYAQKQAAMAADKRRNDMMRAIRSTQDIMTAQSNTPENFKTSEFDYFSKGGRVKKRTGAAKRGFGRAFKGGKK